MSIHVSKVGRRVVARNISFMRMELGMVAHVCKQGQTNVHKLVKETKTALAFTSATYKTQCLSKYKHAQFTAILIEMQAF